MNKIKLFFKKIYSLKIYILIFVLFFAVFFRVFFPDTALISFIFNSLSQKTGYIYDYKNAELSFVPSLKLETEYLKVYKKDQLDLILDNTNIGIPIMSLLFFSPELDFRSDLFGGSIEGYVSDLPIIMSDTSNLLLSILLTNINLKSIISNFIPKYLNLDLGIILSGNVDGKIYPLKTTLSELNLSLQFLKIHLFPTKLFNVDIPEIKLAKGTLNGTIVKSVLNVDKLILGSKKEDLFLSVTGKIALKYNKPYDFRIKATGKGKVKDMLDLALLSLGAKQKDGVFTFRIIGDSKNPIPQVKPE